jgi:Na+-translocating ferredoxin:NAD+ oxidoreductase RNF subunit RnfB
MCSDSGLGMLPVCSVMLFGEWVCSGADSCLRQAMVLAMQCDKKPVRRLLQHAVTSCMR